MMKLRSIEETDRKVPEYEHKRYQIKWDGLHMDQLNCNHASNNKEDAEGCKGHVGIDDSFALQTIQHILVTAKALSISTAGVSS